MGRTHLFAGTCLFALASAVVWLYYAWGALNVQEPPPTVPPAH
jgi:hypothetical protein